MKRNSLRHVADAVTKAIEEIEGIRSIPASERLFQFKITLLEFTPPIWRRIRVKESTLDRFHERIQTAMGWTNSHLHQFEIDGERYGDPELLDDGFDGFEWLRDVYTRLPYHRGGDAFAQTKSGEPVTSNELDELLPDLWLKRNPTHTWTMDTIRRKECRSKERNHRRKRRR